MVEEDRPGAVCSSCSCNAPQTETPHTLISGRFGWRLHREKSSAGVFKMAWYCADCWQLVKGRSNR